MGNEPVMQPHSRYNQSEISEVNCYIILLLWYKGGRNIQSSQHTLMLKWLAVIVRLQPPLNMQCVDAEVGGVHFESLQHCFEDFGLVHSAFLA